MPDELTVLALGSLLLLAHILLAASYATRQYGVIWNAGPRDAPMPPLGAIAGRLERARNNMLETFPIVIVALLGVVIAGKASALTATAAWVWLVARLVYLPLYWAGVPMVRSLAWAVALVAMLVPLGVLLIG